VAGGQLLVSGVGQGSSAAVVLLTAES